ncbi:427_t:CDS:2, partial [Dentiscutata erythropus]
MTENSDKDISPIVSSDTFTLSDTPTASSNTPTTLPNTPAKKTSGKPKSIIWGTHIKQGNQISKGHWNATCNYCSQFWYKGSPAVLKDHLGNLCNYVPPDVCDLFLSQLASKALEVNTSNSKKRKLSSQSNQMQLLDFIESTKLTPEHIKDINRALVKAFVVCGIPFRIVENLFFIELLKTLRPAYEPSFKDVFSGCYLAQETAFVNQDVCNTSFANRMLTCCNTIVSYFKRNHLAGSTLRVLAEENSVKEGGLKQWIDTHWHTILVRLEAAIKRLLENDYHSFRQQVITIFNRRFAEFDDDAYILCFFFTSWIY